MEENKQRIIQEFVPGKQITLAHVIAHPVPELSRKIGAVSSEPQSLGILTITPSEAAIIAGDVAGKAANVELIFVDRFSGSVVVGGDVESVEAALRAVLYVLETTLCFASTEITRS